MESKSFIKNNYWKLFPIAHIIASFFYERSFFHRDTNLSVLFSVPIGNSVSNSVEFYITYTVSKLFSMVLIWFLWKLFFGIIQKKVPSRIVAIFGILFAVFCFIGLIMWPQSLIGDGTSDHLVTYLYAKSFVPYYWHSIFTGCLYSAFLMVAPTAFSIPVLQCLSLFVTLGYIYWIIERYTLKTGRFKWAKYLTFTALISPQFIDLYTNSWRNCFYAILALLFYGIVFETILLKEKTGTIRLIGCLFMAALLSLWRSEGILVGLTGFFVLLFYGYRYHFKKVVLWMVVFAVTFFVLGRPSKIGQEKYYGKDYLMVIFVSPLSNIFNSSDSNLTYPGAESDIQAIEAIVPITVLRQHSYMGYLGNNYSKGFTDIDQTGATKEESAAFIKASVRLILKNPRTFIKTQLNCWLKSFNCEKEYYIENYHYEKEELAGFSHEMWDAGAKELTSEAGVQKWLDNPFRIKTLDTVNNTLYPYYRFWNTTGIVNIKFWGHLLLSFFDALVVLIEFVKFIKNKRRDLSFGLISLTLLGVLAATVLAMPTPYIAYFYTFIYCSVLLLVFYIIKE